MSNILLPEPIYFRPLPDPLRDCRSADEGDSQSYSDSAAGNKLHGKLILDYITLAGHLLLQGICYLLRHPSSHRPPPPPLSQLNGPERAKIREMQTYLYDDLFLLFFRSKSPVDRFL